MWGGFVLFFYKDWFTQDSKGHNTVCSIIIIIIFVRAQQARSLVLFLSVLQMYFSAFLLKEEKACFHEGTGKESACGL